jgi:hypothetical protein
MWQRREIENYLSHPEILLAYAEGVEDSNAPLFTYAEGNRRRQIMNLCIEDLVPRLALRDPQDRWWHNVKASDDFLDRLFEMYFKKLNLPNLMRKANYHVLAQFVSKEMVDDEIKEKLDAIVEVAESAQPLQTKK